MATSLSASPAALRDPTSSAYKKARRQHKRSAQGRQQPTTDSIWTPFRAAEKAYKARFPPPDLSGVLDIATLDNKRQEECTRGGWTGQADAVKWRQIMLRGCNDGMDSGENVAQRTRKGYTVPSIPGARLDHSLFILPGCIYTAHIIRLDCAPRILVS